MFACKHREMFDYLGSRLLVLLGLCVVVAVPAATAEGRQCFFLRGGRCKVDVVCYIILSEL